MQLNILIFRLGLPRPKVYTHSSSFEFAALTIAGKWKLTTEN